MCVSFSQFDKHLEHRKNKNKEYKYSSIAFEVGKI
jgi:hypothetical protein